jgi:hypothetical protein
MHEAPAEGRPVPLRYDVQQSRAVVLRVDDRQWELRRVPATGDPFLAREAETIAEDVSFQEAASLVRERNADLTALVAALQAFERGEATTARVVLREITLPSAGA